jgi:hypothetical protein
MVAAAIVGGAVVGGVASSSSARSASRAQTRASREAIAAQQDSEARALELQRPFYNAGYRATAALMDMTGLDRGKPKPTFDALYNAESGRYEVPGANAPRGAIGNAFDQAAQGYMASESADPGDLAAYPKYNYQQDPGYQFRMDEGVRALDRSASAAGRLNSGGQERRIIRYGQDYASNEYQKVYDRIATIAGFGRSASSESAGVIVNTGANTGNALMNAGEARASGYIAQGNAWANAGNQIGMAYGYGNFGGSGGGGGSDYWSRMAANAQAS